MGLFPKDRDLSRPPERVELPVRAGDFGARAPELSIRLDAFLQRHLSWRSRNSIQSLIQSGHVSLDAATPAAPQGTGRLEVERRPGRRLGHGTRVSVEIPADLRLARLGSAPARVEVLYEDEEVLAVEKPAPLPIHPSGRHLTDTLVQRVHASLAERDALGAFPPKLCHRLDRETSGVVLLAKDARSHAALMRQFERRRVEKEYLALVHGSPEADEGSIELPVGPSRTSRVHLKMAALADGQAARTSWRVLERRDRGALLVCRPSTGRQHQIRVHLEAIGHPILGDKLYGVPEELFLRSAAGALTKEDEALLGLPRHALHASHLVFTSPRTGERRQVESPLPTDLAHALARL